MKPVFVFALPYLADYRRGFFDVLTSRISSRAELVLIHPREPLSESVRTTTHLKSVHSSAVRRIPGGLESQRGIVRRIAHYAPSSVVLEANVRDVSYLRLLLWCRLKRVPVAIWGLGRYNRAERTRAERLAGHVVTCLMVTMATQVIGKGAGPVEYYRKFTRNPQKVVAAPNSSGFEEDLLALPPRPERGPITSNSPLRLLFVGRLIKQKNIDLLLRGLSEVSMEVPWRFEIVGDGPYRSELGDLSEVLDVRDRVMFHGNQIGSDLLEHYRCADALALPGKGGLVVPEALAAGLPVLTGPLDHAGDGTLADLLEDGVNSFIATSLTPADFAVSVQKLRAAVDQDQGGLERCARASFDRHGGVDAMAEVFESFLFSSPSGQAGRSKTRRYG